MEFKEANHTNSGDNVHNVGRCPWGARCMYASSEVLDSLDSSFVKILIIHFVQNIITGILSFLQCSQQNNDNFKYGRKILNFKQ